MSEIKNMKGFRKIFVVFAIVIIVVGTMMIVPFSIPKYLHILLTSPYQTLPERIEIMNDYGTAIYGVESFEFNNLQGDVYTYGMYSYSGRVLIYVDEDVIELFIPNISLLQSALYDEYAISLFEVEEGDWQIIEERWQRITYS